MKANARYRTSILREAERELEAATTRTSVNEAAAKLMGAKVKLRRLQQPVSVSHSTDVLQAD